MDVHLVPMQTICIYLHKQCTTKCFKGQTDVISIGHHSLDPNSAKCRRREESENI